MSDPVIRTPSVQLEALSMELAATALHAPPVVRDADLWIEAIDELTNQTSWLRRDLLAEITDLRLRLWGAG